MSAEPNQVTGNPIEDVLIHDKAQTARELLPLVYGELRRLAALRLAHESPGQTLQPAALVHEAYLRVVGADGAKPWDNRAHFSPPRPRPCGGSWSTVPATASALSVAAAAGTGRRSTSTGLSLTTPTPMISLTSTWPWRNWPGSIPAPPSWSSCVSSPGSHSMRQLRSWAWSAARPSATGLLRVPGCFGSSVRENFFDQEVFRVGFGAQTEHFRAGMIVPDLMTRGISPMNPSEADLKSIFCEALNHPAGADRAAYLDRACGSNTALRLQVESLLKAHDEAGSFLSSGVAQPASASAANSTRDHTPEPAVVSESDPTASAGGSEIAEGPGTTIGPYKLLQKIGEGGMGAVFMAEQERPVRRKVALKVIKPGMDTARVIARFEAERQALAIMDHINIARVLDAGATATGRPFFVMELVKGVPITEYCDRNHLTPRERLELFIPVCQAIQHAHQKGIIHRDIKPSNVLVTLHDGTPVAKVIDFGVAKAIDQRLTEKTLFTEFGAVIGTLEYMSSEQAEMVRSILTRAATSTRSGSCCMNCSPARRRWNVPSSARPRTRRSSAASATKSQ